MKHPTIKLSYNAPVALTFAILALLALVADGITGGWTTRNLFSVYRCSLSDPLAWFRFFGHVLGHSGFSHYIGNIVLILVLGPNLEDRFGSWNVLWAILLTALISGVVQFVFFPGSALLGASGIVFMMILLSSFGGVRNGIIPITLILVAVFYLGGELWDAIFKHDNISQLTHIIGGICGTVLGFALSGKKRH
ncbi:MAG: rhomboid family intramembrane serine protease [Oscillospiraceae bacterium]|nr:rhomboid family intramembrane serine protease [Oscillospiraceae bacterium]